MRTFLLTALVVATPSFAFGPILGGGVLGTHTSGGTGSALYLGPVVRLGVEFGERFNHELAVEELQLPRFDRPGTAHAILGRYTFSVDFLGKRGFSPLVGLGLGGGRFFVVDAAERVSGWALSLNAIAGLRYTFEFGLTLKAEVAGSYYGGGLFSLSPAGLVGWQF